jgi:hypothetical protein
MQRITHAEWSWYLLKYVAKAEPAGSLNINKSHLEALGLYDITDAQAQLASAAILARTISIGEAALVLAGIPLVSSDVDMSYVDTRCPETRTRVCWGNHISVPASDVYFMRPVAYADYTPKQYFTNCTVRKPNQPRPRTSQPESLPLLDDAGNKVGSSSICISRFFIGGQPLRYFHIFQIQIGSPFRNCRMSSRSIILLAVTFTHIF